ncbi:MAG: hypothetical protein JWM11_7628 [Planctomycetaceae bacterium]|nr:hypothetical protein [Planctomycetaceae bacterium]
MSTPMSTPATGFRRRLQRLRSLYFSAAILVLNTLVVYFLLNVALGIVFLVRDAFRAKTNPVSLTYGARLDAVYPDFPEPERTQMLSEAWNRPYRYADFIHFQERPCVGKYVNVDEAGFRHSIAQGPWPPDPKHLNIFCFGGSTMFGYGLPDDQTVASCLQRALAQDLKRRVCVYNFGVGWHYSTQERLRFELLLASEFVPDIALFLDGINDSTQAGLNRPAFSPQLSAAFEQVQGFGFQSPARSAAATSGSVADALIYRWPVGRLIHSLAPRRTASNSVPILLDDHLATRSCAVYRWNRDLITAAAKMRGVVPIFVLQPAPGYHLDPEKHLFANPDLCRNEALFYETLKLDLNAHPAGNNFLWTADLVDTTAGPLYVDTCHYTATFSQTIATEILRVCQKRGLIQIKKLTEAAIP